MIKRLDYLNYCGSHWILMQVFTKQIVSICQASEPNCRSVGAKCDVKETLPDDSESSPPVNFALYGKGYVCLPNRSASRSTQDLFSHSEANTCTQRHDTADTTQWADKTEANAGLGEPISSCQPPASTPGPITGWPQGGTMQASGYCQLPTAHMRAEHWRVRERHIKKDLKLRLSLQI